MAYLGVLVLVFVMTTLGLTYIYAVRTRSMAEAGRLDSVQAGYLAESAANHALWRVLHEDEGGVSRYILGTRDDAHEESGKEAELDASKLEYGKKWYVGLRFQDVALARGAMVNAAHVRVLASDSDDKSTRMTIFGEAADDAVAFRAVAGDLSGRTKTLASVAWTSVLPWTKDSAYQTPDLSPLVQEIVNRPGWVSGNSIVFLFRSDDLSGERRAYARDDADRIPALLTIQQGASLPMSAAAYAMHSLAGGRYGYKVRRPTDTMFGTVATVGAVGESTVGQSYVLSVEQTSGVSAVTVDKATDKEEANKKTASWGHSVGGSPNRLLVVCGSVHGNRTMTSVTYAGVPLTFLGSVSAEGSARHVAMWYLVNPPVGNEDVAVTFNLKTHFRLGAVSFFNVDQTSPLGPFVGNSSSSSLPAVSLASGVGELVLDTIACEQGRDPVLAPFDQTEHWNGKGGDEVWGAGSTKDGAATVSMSWSLDASSVWAAGAVSIRPATTSP